MKRNKKEKEYNEIIESDIIQYINENYCELDKIKFAYQLYIEPYELNFKGLEQYLECLHLAGHSETEKKIENILLFKSLESNQNLMLKVVKIIDIENERLYHDILKINYKQQYTDVNIEKYRNNVLIFANIFSNRVKENRNIEQIGNIASLLDTNKKNRTS